MSDPSKYGQSLPSSAWTGLPIRVGHFPDRGTVYDLESASDTLLVWTAASSEVELHYAEPGQSTRTSIFQRRAGMLDFMPAGTSLREVNWRDKGNTSVFSVNFPNAVVRSLLTHDPGEEPTPRGAAFGLMDSHLLDLSQRLRQEVDQGAPLGAAYVQGLTLTLSAYVMRKFGRETLRGSGAVQGAEAVQGAGAVQGAEAQLFREALVAFIEDNLASNLGLVDLAKVAGYGPDHFARLFKREFGVAPHDYLIGRRLERAKTLLRSSRRSIAEVALACGFASHAHLSAVFRRRIGTTPTAYRRG